jgi:hypothetical protein
VNWLPWSVPSPQHREFADTPGVAFVSSTSCCTTRRRGWARSSRALHTRGIDDLAETEFVPGIVQDAIAVLDGLCSAVVNVEPSAGVAWA